MTWETACVEREDQQHCNCWYDGEPCCMCGEAGDDYVRCVAVSNVKEEKSHPWLGGIFLVIVIVELALLVAFC